MGGCRRQAGDTSVPGLILHTLPSRGVPVLAGRGRLERATCRGVSLRHDGTEATGAGKPARRFLAASPVSVIRVDPTRPPAHQCA